jgi:hypothetical protein
VFSTGRGQFEGFVGASAQVAQNEELTCCATVYFEVYIWKGTKALDGARTAKQSNRQQEKRADKPQHSRYGDAEKAKRQSQEPNEGVCHQSQQRHRPAQNKQDAPQEESSHGNLTWELQKPLAHLHVRLPPFN